MHFLYGKKAGVDRRLVATFDSEAQLRAYVGWSTLYRNPDGKAKFEQGSALAGYVEWEDSTLPLTLDPEDEVVHNPSPSML
jgi:hypothetical protein